LHDDCGSAGAASKIRADSVVADSERGDDGNVPAEIPVCEHTLTVPIFDPLLKRPDVLACSRLDRSTPREKAKGREDDAYSGLTNMVFTSSGMSPWGLLAVSSSQSSEILVYEVQYYSERQATTVSIGQLEYNTTKTSTTTMPMPVVFIREINIPEHEVHYSPAVVFCTARLTFVHLSICMGATSICYGLRRIYSLELSDRNSEG
jgi:hypothetical protein